LLLMLLLLLNGLLGRHVAHLRTASGYWRRDDLLLRRLMMIDDLMRLLLLLRWIALMQMLASTRHVVLAAILRLHNLSRRFYDVNFTHVLHQSLQIGQWRLIALCTNAIAPQTVIDDRLILSGQLAEVTLNTSNAFGNCMLERIAWIFKLIIALVPSALKDLQRERLTIRINEKRQERRANRNNNCLWILWRLVRT